MEESSLVNMNVIVAGDPADEQDFTALSHQHVTRVAFARNVIVAALADDATSDAGSNTQPILRTINERARGLRQPGAKAKRTAPMSRM